MAEPPEPLAELLALATLVVIAEVTRVVKLGPAPPAPENAANLQKGATSVGWVSPSETLRLKVTRVLRGDVQVNAELTVEKPVAPYLLKAGFSGPFLVDANKKILGRYGPDSHALAKIEAALTRVSSTR
ncbi:MAG TPA: hypothetical protein VGO62_02450, partial [Myxococcota bacterium]